MGKKEHRRCTRLCCHGGACACRAAWASPVYTSTPEDARWRAAEVLQQQGMQQHTHLSPGCPRGCAPTRPRARPGCSPRARRLCSRPSPSEARRPPGCPLRLALNVYHPRQARPGHTQHRPPARPPACSELALGHTQHRPPARSHSLPPAVELVLGVQDEEDVEGARQARVGPVAGVDACVQHVQEVLRGRGGRWCGCGSFLGGGVGVGLGWWGGGPRRAPRWGHEAPPDRPGNPRSERAAAPALHWRGATRRAPASQTGRMHGCARPPAATTGRHRACSRSPQRSPGSGWAARACGPRRGGRPARPAWGSCRSAAQSACPAPRGSGRCSAPPGRGSAGPVRGWGWAGRGWGGTGWIQCPEASKGVEQERLGMLVQSTEAGRRCNTRWCIALRRAARAPTAAPAAGRAGRGDEPCLLRVQGGQRAEAGEDRAHGVRVMWQRRNRLLHRHRQGCRHVGGGDAPAAAVERDAARLAGDMQLRMRHSSTLLPPAHAQWHQDRCHCEPPAGAAPTGVSHHCIRPALQLAGGWQAAVHHEVRHLSRAQESSEGGGGG